MYITFINNKGKIMGITTKSSCFKMYMFIQFVLYIICSLSDCRKTNQIDNRLKVLEKKFAIQAYENALMQEEVLEINHRLSEMENSTGFMSPNMDKRENENEGVNVKQVQTDCEDLPYTTAILPKLLKAFQTEKMERLALQRELRRMEESYQFEKEILQSKIDLLESNQQEFEKLLSEQTKTCKMDTETISENLDALNESFLSFMDTDVIGQVSKLDTKIDTVQGMVTANTALLAKSTEDKLNSVITNITDISKHVLRSPVSFYAILTKSISDLGSWKTLVFNNVVTNIGRGYSANTGVFTAPTNGVYLFHTHVLGSSRALEMCMQKNGNTLLWLYVNGPGHGQDGNMIVLQLAKGDNVKVVKHGPWGSRPFYVHPSWTNFAGTLLYQL